MQCPLIILVYVGFVGCSKRHCPHYSTLGRNIATVRSPCRSIASSSRGGIVYAISCLIKSLQLLGLLDCLPVCNCHLFVSAGGCNVVEIGVLCDRVLLSAKPLGPGAEISGHSYLSVRVHAFENSVGGCDHALRRLQLAICDPGFVCFLRFVRLAL